MSMNSTIKRTYRRKIRELADSVRSAELGKEDAVLCAAGALLKIWDEYDFEPATAIGKHECAYQNGRMDIDLALEWGGSRQGAGRHLLADKDPTVDSKVCLPASLDAKAKLLGNGNRSAGIRKALEICTL